MGVFNIKVIVTIINGVRAVINIDAEKDGRDVSRALGDHQILMTVRRKCGRSDGLKSIGTLGVEP